MHFRLAVLASLTLSGIGASAAEPCDRACLEGFVNQYLAALTAGDPEKRPRAELARVANSYFEGMEAGTGKNTPFDTNCQRIENGVITSNDPSSKSDINRIEALVTPVPYGMYTGWPAPGRR